MLLQPGGVSHLPAGANQTNLDAFEWMSVYPDANFGKGTDLINSKIVQCYSHLRVKKAYTSNRKLLPVAPDDILRSYEVKQSVIARK